MRGWVQAAESRPTVLADFSSPFVTRPLKMGPEPAMAVPEPEDVATPEVLRVRGHGEVLRADIHSEEGGYRMGGRGLHIAASTQGESAVP